MIKAKNAYGWSEDFSPLTATKYVGSAVPQAPPAATISLDATNVAITWTTPTSNQATITSYRVKIQRRVGSTFPDYVESTSLCDGS